MAGDHMVMLVLEDPEFQGVHIGYIDAVVPPDETGGIDRP
jgi:hypothetical protein